MTDPVTLSMVIVPLAGFVTVTKEETTMVPSASVSFARGCTVIDVCTGVAAWSSVATGGMSVVTITVTVPVSQ